VLPGITRDTIITLAQDLGLDVKEQALPREMVYVADEMFFVGTAVEVTPIKSVDKIQIGDGKRGPVTAAIQQAFFDCVNGVTPDRHGWLTYVNSAGGADVSRAHESGRPQPAELWDIAP
jgi:branched-chain amino acid aminotransferase